MLVGIKSFYSRFKRWLARLRVKQTIMFVQRIKTKIENNESISEIEKEYITAIYPKILELSLEHYWCTHTGASRERDWLSKKIDELQKKADKRLREAGISIEEQRFLEDLVYFSDIKYPEVIGIDCFKHYHQVLIEHSQSFPKFKRAKLMY